MLEQEFITSKELEDLLKRFGKIKELEFPLEGYDLDEFIKKSKNNSFDCEDWDGSSCNYHYIKLDGEVYQRNNFFFDSSEFCRVCNILNKDGNYHHFGCNIEMCPRCKKQLISCNCFIEGIFKTNHK